MDYLLIEKRAYEQMKTRIEYLSQFVLDFSAKFGQKKQESWMDAADVCLALNITKRTLQYYRESGKIPFSKFGNKYYYHAELIHKIFVQNSIKTGQSPCMKMP